MEKSRAIARREAVSSRVVAAVMAVLCWPEYRSMRLAGWNGEARYGSTKVRESSGKQRSNLTPLPPVPRLEDEGSATREGAAPLHRMLLAREFVAYLSRQLAAKLGANTIEIINPASVADLIHNLINEELAVEDKLNDEVRDILEQYSVYMSNNAISYSEMFRKIKNQLVAQRKIVRASGRETGDQMKLSRDKINEISHKLVQALKRSRDCRFRKDANDVRLEVVRLFAEILQQEERADKAARNKIRSMKKEIAEGTEEWAIEHRKLYANELKSLGIDLNS